MWQAECLPSGILEGLALNDRGYNKVNFMLSRCANPQCSKPFLRLRDGKLFLVETDRTREPGESLAPPFVRARRQQRLVEHYWLCNDCASHWSLVYDRNLGVALTPLARPAMTSGNTDQLKTA